MDAVTPAPPAAPRAAPTTESWQDVPVAQRRNLAALEGVVERGQQTFIEVGLALGEIRDRRLYREQGHATFEEYCQKRWGWSRQNAQNYITAAQVGATVQPVVQSPPGLRQAMTLAPLPEAEQRAVAQEVDFSQTTVRELQQVVRERLPEKPAKSHAESWDERRAAIAQAAAQRPAPATLEARFDRIERADALTYLRSLPEACADVCVTSPPYWAKRTYVGTDPAELGQEPDPQTYVEALRRIVGHIGRVLVPTGWLFLNLGDTYASNPGGYRGDPERWRGISEQARRVGATAPADRRYDVPKKSLCLVPWRLLTALVQHDGWRCRNVVAWHKPNHLPENVGDRLTQAWEPVLVLTRSEAPYFARGQRAGDLWSINAGGDAVAQAQAHPAPFPPELVRRIVDHACPPGGVVLDPFCGSGTTLRVARTEGRRFLGCDLVADEPVGTGGGA